MPSNQDIYEAQARWNKEEAEVAERMEAARRARERAEIEAREADWADDAEWNQRLLAAEQRAAYEYDYHPNWGYGD